MNGWKEATLTSKLSRFFKTPKLDEYFRLWQQV